MGEDGGDVVAGVDGAAPVEEMGGQADRQQLGETLADVPGVDGVRSKDIYFRVSGVEE